MFNNTVTPGLQACCVFALLFTISQAALADSDLDGIEDALDNCIFHPNPLQADTDADGFGNQCDADFNNDLFVNVADLAFFRSVFGTSNVHADLDTNAIVNFADLAAFKSLFGATPGPAGSAVYPLTASDDAKIVVENLQVTTRCSDAGLATHIVEGRLNVAGGIPGATTLSEASVTFFDGKGNTGSTTTSSDETHFFTISLEEATVSSVNQGQLSISSLSNPGIIGAQERFQLSGCAAPLEPIEILSSPTDPDLPPVFGTEPGAPNEVDIIHLGGAPQGPTDTRIVTAAGTGAGARLYSYRMDNVSHDPVYLDESPSFGGFDIKLLTLSEEFSPDLTVDPFVVASRLNGDLWLRTWQLAADGSFRHFTGRGYGTNAHLTVEAYAIAHRVLDSGNYQVVTPIRTDQGRLRIITWLIDRNTGDIFGRFDSDSFGEPSAATELSISHLNDGVFVLSYTKPDGLLKNHYWLIENDGTPRSRGETTSGLNIRGTGPVNTQAEAVINLPILTDDFITPVFFPASSNPDRSDFRLYTWETRTSSAFDLGYSVYLPHQISHSDKDNSPNAHGIDLGYLPTVTSDEAAPPSVRAMLSDNKVADFNLSDGELFTQTKADPAELTEVQFASVTKNMVLLLAVEAINAGHPALDAEVEVSKEAAETEGSSVGSGPGLETGEIQTLELLLHGMMLTSGNDAAAAVAEVVGGNIENFIHMMNIRADELGMTNTTYWVPDDVSGGPGGGGTSTPEDQIKLWRFAREIPLFAQLAKAETYFGCGTSADGGIKCWDLVKFNDGGYLGMNGWKGGNGGWPIHDYTVVLDGPWCIGSGCLIAESYRMDRPFIASIQNSNNRWADAARLWDFGLESQFTPDRRGPTVSSGSITDFALDGVGELSTASIHIADSGRTVEVCTWETLADSGTINNNACVQLNVTGLAASTNQAAPTQIDGALLGTTFADGEYITGHRSLAGSFQLNLWRVGNLNP